MKELAEDSGGRDGAALLSWVMLDSQIIDVIRVRYGGGMYGKAESKYYTSTYSTVWGDFETNCVIGEPQYST